MRKKMPKYRVELDRTEFYTIEEIDAKDEYEAVEIAIDMVIEGHDDIIFNDQEPDDDYTVYDIGEK